jgi:protoporphyrinogen oxidase
MNKKAIIIGAGPAGLTAAYELLTKTDIIPVIIEKSDAIGGLSRTVVHNGNRMDIGGHRFFSKSDRVMEWWQNILPLQGSGLVSDVKKEISYQQKTEVVTLAATGPDPSASDKVMLVRKRLSRIFFIGKFFSYPIALNKKTIANLGANRMVKIGLSYIWVRLFKVKNIRSLEDFFISRFGKELYLTFFKDYTEKVWGLPCTAIDASWGVQRIKKLSISRALLHAMSSAIKNDTSISQKNTDTSLIEQFLYPKLGPGQMWETVADIIKEKGAIIIKNSDVTGINITKQLVTGLTYTDNHTGIESVVTGDYFISTMPIKDLVAAMGNDVPDNVRDVAQNLQYRDFITVGLLLNKLKIKNDDNAAAHVADNWIYIQEKEVKLGRLQIFNNWSPYMVADTNKIWIGLEYFCNEGDELWSMTDEDFIKFAIEELHQINVIDRADVIDRTIVRMLKTYPAYFGSYSRFDVISNFTNQLENLFLIGRNGMHKYNNQDHSMLTAMVAVENIINGEKTKANLWEINTEQDFHETKRA